MSVLLRRTLWTAKTAVFGLVVSRHGVDADTHRRESASGKISAMMSWRVSSRTNMGDRST